MRRCADLEPAFRGPRASWFRASLSAALLLFVLAGAGPAVTLQEAFERAGPREGYDKYLELDTGVTYTGGLLIGPIYSPLAYGLDGPPGCDVRIDGRGAILDLQGGQICMSYCANRLDLSDCVILNGNVRFRGISSFDTTVSPVGSVRHVTFFRPHDYAIRLYGAGSGITLERNLAVDVIDTGWDFLYHTGISSSWLPTGTSFSLSGQEGFFGVPQVTENWTWHSDPTENLDPLTHFSLLCEWG